MAILLALLAAGSNTFATVLQRLGVEQSTGARPGLMASVLRRPIWFLGLGLMSGSFLLQAFALSLGTLSTVQPIMVIEIVFLVVILGVWFHRPLGWRELGGSAGAAAGLGAFLAISATTGGGQRPNRTEWLLLAIASIGAVGLSLVATRGGSRLWRAAAYGVAAAICFALTAACIKTVADQWSAGPVYVFTHFESYGVAISGLAGLIISQHALEAGPVAASQSAMLIVNPIASIVMGIWLFGDRLHTTVPHIAGAVASLAVMFVSLVILSSSPLVAASASTERLSSASPVVDTLSGGVR